MPQDLEKDLNDKRTNQSSNQTVRESKFSDVTIFGRYGREEGSDGWRNSQNNFFAKSTVREQK